MFTQDAITEVRQHFLHPRYQEKVLSPVSNKETVFWRAIILDGELNKRIRCCITKSLRRIESHPSPPLITTLQGTVHTPPPIGYFPIPLGSAIPLGKTMLIVNVVDSQGHIVQQWMETSLISRLKMLSTILNTDSEIPRLYGKGFPDKGFPNTSILPFAREDVSPMRRTYLFQSVSIRDMFRKMFIQLEKDINGKLTKSAIFSFVLSLLNFFFPCFVVKYNIEIAQQYWAMWTRRGRDRPDYDLFFLMFFEWPLVLMKVNHVTEEMYIEFWDLVFHKMKEHQQSHNTISSLASTRSMLPKWLLEAQRRMHGTTGHDSPFLVSPTYKQLKLPTFTSPVLDDTIDKDKKEQSETKCPDEDNDLDNMIDYFVGMSDAYVDSASFSLRRRYEEVATLRKKRQNVSNSNLDHNNSFKENSHLSNSVSAHSEGLQATTPDSQQVAVKPSLPAEKIQQVRRGAHIRLMNLEIPNTARQHRPFININHPIHAVTPRPPPSAGQTHRRAVMLVSPHIRIM